MSGHSKWATTKRAKGAADAKRGAIFTKLANAISIAAKLGGGNPEINFRLRLAIDKAKGASMPKDNIERAIKRGTGEGDGGPIETLNYEGFGPDGIAIIIEALTDNRNRTSSDIKHILTKYGGNLGGPSAVAWMFESKGIIRTGEISEDQELELIDAGALDLVREDEGTTIYSQPTDLNKIKELLEKKNLAVEYAEVEMVPKEKKKVTAEVLERLEKMLNELDNNDDVSDYYTNLDE